MVELYLILRIWWFIKDRRSDASNQAADAGGLQPEH